jgi:hypothetical protein
MDSVIKDVGDPRNSAVIKARRDQIRKQKTNLTLSLLRTLLLVAGLVELVADVVHLLDRVLAHGDSASSVREQQLVT